MSYIYVPLTQEYWRQMPDEARPRHCEDTRGIVALRDDGEIQAICVMDTWSHNACQIHMWIENPFVLKHGFPEEIANFVYSSGRDLMIGVTPADNEKALKFNKHMGMVEHSRIPDGYAKGIDYVVTIMKKSECRWLKQPKEAANGQ